MERKEARIRDELSSRLDLIELGLELLSVEQYLPNPQGTRGFVDLFAKDKSGKYVLIEIKRSDASSREALHEVLKYIEAAKLKLSARDSEIRVFIVSTEWKELLIPFSSFIEKVAYDVKGFDLKVDNNQIPISSNKVVPLALTSDRLFAPWHELNLYESHVSLEKGLQTYEESCSAKGIKNYVLVILKPRANFHEETINTLNENYKDYDFDFSSLREHKYAIYFACLQLSEDVCWSAIKQSEDEEDLEQFKDYVEDMVGVERLCTLHEKVYDVNPKAKRDFYEIGYPAKFSNKLLQDEGWSIEEIRRYGTLKANELLEDQAILDDLGGADGNSPNLYRKFFSPSVRSEVAEVRAGVQRCLKDNTLWRNQIIRILDEFLPIENELNAEIEIFNPGNFCLSLYLFSNRDDGASYMPHYSLVFKKGEEVSRFVFGSMNPNGLKPSFSEMLDKYHSGSGAIFLQSLSWGGYDYRDIQISKDLGMTYKTFMIEVNGEHKSFFELTEMGWEKSKKTHPMEGFFNYIENNKDFCRDVYDYYSSHWNGSMHFHQADEENEFRT